MELPNYSPFNLSLIGLLGDVNFLVYYYLIIESTMKLMYLSKIDDKLHQFKNGLTLDHLPES